MLFCNIDLLDEKFETKRNQYVGVKNGRIAYIGASAPEEDFGERYDGRHRLLMPAFYNVHSHAPMTLLRGYAENLPLQRWLGEKVFPFEDQIDDEAAYYGTLLAISGAEFLKDLGMPSAGSLLGIIIFTGMLNLLITSATSKWAILSTIFVPMLMMLGISPELTQAAFRVSDSAVNVCTPMFPFYPLLIMYCQKYCKQAGVGTLSSMMIPYTLALLVALTFVLYAFWGIGIPIGFDSGYVYPPVK